MKKRWEKWEEDLLKILYPYLPNRELTDYLSRSYHSIRRKGNRLGLIKTPIAIHAAMCHNGILNPMYGKQHSDETKIKISKANMNPSEETKRKMSIAQKGHVVSEETRRKLCISSKDRCVSDETRKKISRKALERYGNRRKSVERFSSNRWRSIAKKIRKRDGYQCQICSIYHSSEEPLSVHHIVPWHHSQCNDESNLISLCVSCHQKVEYETSFLSNRFDESPFILFEEVRRRLKSKSK